MSEEWVAGIDLGTSYFKIGLFARSGELGGLGRIPVKTDTDDSSRELQVKDFEQLISEAWLKACRETGENPDTINISAISYSSQANSFILLDACDRPQTPLILWSDLRAENPEQLLNDYNTMPDRAGTTGIGLNLSPFLCINKLLWLRRTEPGLFRKARRVMTISDYFLFRLTGNHAGDLGTATLLSIVDQRKGDWWPKAIEHFDVQPEMLAKLSPPGTNIGVTHDNALVWKPGIPVISGGLDHSMAAIGAGTVAYPSLSVSLGTVLACIKITSHYQPLPECCVGRAFAGNKYYTLAFCQNGGGNLEWYKNNFAARMSFADLDKAADRIPHGCEGLRAEPDTASKPGLTGFLNALPKHTPGHYFRALMESSATSLKNLLDLLDDSAPIILTGGGAQSSVWRGIIRKITGRKILPLNCEEPACRGAAMTAATAAGWFKSITAASQAWMSPDSAEEQEKPQAFKT